MVKSFAIVFCLELIELLNLLVHILYTFRYVSLRLFDIDLLNFKLRFILVHLVGLANFFLQIIAVRFQKCGQHLLNLNCIFFFFKKIYGWQNLIEIYPTNLSKMGFFILFIFFFRLT